MAVSSYLKDGVKLYKVELKVRDQYGKQVFRSRQGILSERKARDVEFELRKELESHVEDRPIGIWEDWLSHCVRTMRLEMQPSTCDNYEGRLAKWVTPHWKGRELSSITKLEVHQLIFQEFTDEDMSQNSRKTILKLLKRVFEMAIEEGVIERNPCKGITVRVAEVQQDVLTNSEVETFLSEAKACSHEFYPVWVMALMTGMRSGELMALEWSDIDLDARIIRVSKQWDSKLGYRPTKTLRSRVVPINDELVKFLKEWKLESGKTDKFVLPRLWRWEQGQQALVTRQFCKSVGITTVKFHDLRATFITNLLSRGVSLARVMSMVGHTQLKTTNGYLRKAGVDVKGSTDSLGYKLPRESLGQVFSLKDGGKI